ncbi:MAG: FG-GAP-like repeat-containing protein, partial [Candidatus Heimdallarchaeota archaeon]
MKNKSAVLVICLIFISSFLIQNNVSGKLPENETNTFSINAVTVSESWSFETSGSVESSPTIADIDKDGNYEVLIGSKDNYLYCLNSTGGEVWSFDTQGPISLSSPTVADIDDDDRLEILIPSSSGILWCLDEDGIEEWHFDCSSPFYGSCVVADVDLDDKFEIIVGADNGNLYCLNETGNQQWNYTFDSSSIRNTPTIGDLDQDGFPEIVFASFDSPRVICLDNTGQHLWNYNGSGTFTSSPSIGDVTGDGNYEIVIGSETGALYCLNSTGDELWTHTSTDDYTSTAALVDLEGDGYDEILVGGDDDLFICLNRTGDVVWSYNAGNNIASSAAVCDLDNDGSLEIIFGDEDYSGTNSHNLTCLDDAGNYLWHYTLSDDIYSSPAIGDLDQDGQLEVVFGSGYPGQPSGARNLYCLTLIDSSVAGAMPWGSFHGSMFNVGIKDSDSDMLDDFTETFYGTSVTSNDSDSDTLNDWYEIYYLMTDPTDSDTDSDLMPDNYELAQGFDPLIDDAGDDADTDTLTNLEEYQETTDPHNNDTDADGLLDGVEVHIYSSDPLD